MMLLFALGPLALFSRDTGDLTSASLEDLIIKWKF